MPVRPPSMPGSLLGRIPRYRSSFGLLNASAAIIGMTSLLLLVQISGVASMAYEVQRLEDLRTYWQEANYRAETDIARLQSLGRVEQEATARLQMVPAPTKEIVHVIMASPVQTRAPRPEAAGTSPPKAGSSQSWWQGLMNLVSQVREGP